MFGKIESESCIRQNAGIKGIYAIERRDFRSWTRTRHKIGVCQKWSIVYIYSTLGSELYRRADIYRIYIGLMFGHFESESGIQQNAGIKGIDAVARRDSRSIIYNNIYASWREKGWYTVLARDRENRTFRLAALSLVQYSTVHSIVERTAIARRENCTLLAKLGFSPPNWTLPVNNMVKREELT
jgi:hypothetical protein